MPKNRPPTPGPASVSEWVRLAAAQTILHQRTRAMVEQLHKSGLRKV